MAPDTQRKKRKEEKIRNLYNIRSPPTPESIHWLIDDNQSPNQLLTASNPRIVTTELGTVRTRLTPNPLYKPLIPSSCNTVLSACKRPLYFASGWVIPPLWFCNRVRRTSWGYVAPEASALERIMARISLCIGNGRGFAWCCVVKCWSFGGQSSGWRACLRYSSAGNWTTTWDTPNRLGSNPE